MRITMELNYQNIYMVWAVIAGLVIHLLDRGSQ